MPMTFYQFQSIRNLDHQSKFGSNLTKRLRSLAVTGIFDLDPYDLDLNLT